MLSLTTNIAIPLFVSNFITITLIVFFGRDRSRQRSAYRDQIARLESQSLKAQMNLHFIYNTLNGIQSVLMLKGEEKANQYVGIFSRMLRKTLDMSSSDNMTLSEEIDYIQGYIALQNIRLERPINFSVTFENKLNPDTCLIAPMLLQPIVENTIIHGLVHQKEEGLIELKVKHSEDSLVLHVEDNGMGRKAASRLQKTNALGKNVHKSHATKILKERIDILNYIYKTKSVFYLEDILDEGIICGTRAVLIVPEITAKNKAHENV